MSSLDNIHINPLGFREYDARWLYPKDINKEGIKRVGQGLGSQIISKTNKSPRVIFLLIIVSLIKNLTYLP